MDKCKVLAARLRMIVVKKGWITRQEFEDALKEQQRLAAETGAEPFVGDVMVQMGMITADQRDILYDIQEKFGGSRPDAPMAINQAGLPTDPGSGECMVLTVSETNLAAWIKPKTDDLSAITREEIKACLEKHGIVYGIVDDDTLTAYLSDNDRVDSKPPARWLIAQGRPACAGTGPDIRYHFAVHPLKAGNVHNDGTIDYKDRGDIPQVKEGDLLVEISPGQPGKPGMDVFGNPVPPPEPPSAAVKCGAGTRLSKDGCQVLAVFDGRPELVNETDVCVFPELAISGDIGYETGHVEFDGHIDVQGCIQDGFKVKGHSLRANEIGKAQIDIKGDIHVHRGIISADIKCDGSVRAKFIHSATLDVLTDVVVENEILDAAIEANGACVVARGKILSSRISARKGILASEIGSLQTSPCDLIVGVDNRLKKDVSGLKEKISERKARCQQIEASIQELGQKDEAVEAQLTELSQNEGEIIIKKLEDPQMAAETHQVAKVQEALQLMEVKIEQIQDTVTALLEEQEEIQDRQDIYQMQMQHIGDEITGLESEINHLMEMSKKENGHACIKALDEIFPRTRLKGPHAALTLKDNHKRVSIGETRADVEGHAHRWQIQIASL